LIWDATLRRGEDVRCRMVAAGEPVMVLRAVLI
jgi:hypothetical protein